MSTTPEDAPLQETVLRNGTVRMNADGIVTLTWLDPPLAPMDPNADPVPQRVISIALGTATILEAAIPDDDQVG